MVNLKLLFIQYINMGKLKIWATEEDEILVKISEVAKSKKWKRASEQLERLGFDRSDVECRERYVNHLDPCVNKEGWSDEELEILYRKYGQYGNKWFLLQKNLPGRTQTKIKNYFYGRIRFFLKIIIKLILKTNTGFIGDIKTDTLLDIYEAKNKFQKYQIIHKTIKKLRYKIEKKSCIKLVKQNLEQFQEFAYFFFANYSGKGMNLCENSVEEDESQREEQEIPREEVQLGAPTIINLVSSTGGITNDIQDQKIYLKSMTQLHWKQYEHYKEAYLSIKEPNQQIQ